jgi:HSP20 family molecular chaperone IbpA
MVQTTSEKSRNDRNCGDSRCGDTEAQPVRTQPVERESQRRYRPNVDILEAAGELTVLADVPGARREDVDIHFEQGVLTVKATVNPRQPQGTQYLKQEYGVGGYQRSFQVSEHIDAERIHADLHDGVLTLHLPKVEAAKPRKIEIKAP